MPTFNFGSLKKDPPKENTEDKELEKVKEILRIEEQKEESHDPALDFIFDEVDLHEAEEIVDSLNTNDEPAQSDEKPTEEQSEKIKPKKKTAKKKSSKKKTTGKKNSEQTEPPAENETKFQDLHLEDLYVTSDQVWELMKKRKSGQFINWIKMNKPTSEKCGRTAALDQITNLFNELNLENVRKLCKEQ